MKTNKAFINPKKIPYTLALGLLTAGASLILGFLSFGGMYALLPVLPLAFTAFGLSVAYEGEIYLQNIKGSLNKLFKNNYLKHHLAKEYLLEHFPKNTDDPACPEFFKDYEKELKLLATFEHKKLNSEQRKQKRQIKKSLKYWEHWFSLELFPVSETSRNNTSTYSSTLKGWLADNKQSYWQDKLIKRRTVFHIASAFSGLSALFMALGSTYLIVEAFSVIPWMAAIPFAAWPFFIVPMALIAGAAYGLLTYNTLTDLINNDTLNKWYKQLHEGLFKNLSIRTVFMAAMAGILVVLATALTICTAGTWWTVASNSRPLFEWMKKMPSFIMGIINPLITGFSAVFFNIQNTSESLEMLDDASHSLEKTLKSNTNIVQMLYQSIKNPIKNIRSTEHWMQIINPFRLLLKLSLTPLRVLFFFGHLASIALTADRMPGVPQIIAALIALITEGFEDAHYFIGHTHKADHNHHHCTHTLLEERLKSHGSHNHNIDIPTQILQTLALPLYALAAIWDWKASQLNSKGSSAKQLSFIQAWNKQRGIKEELVEPISIEINPEDHPSKEWQLGYTLGLIENYEKEHLSTVFIGSDIALEKKKALEELQNKIRNPNTESLQKILEKAESNPVYNKHRLFSAPTKQTRTQRFIEDLQLDLTSVR